MANRFVNCRVYFTDVNGYQRSTHNCNSEVTANLLIFKECLELAHNEQVIAVEVYAEEHHKHGANPLYINAVTRYAVIFDSEAAGSCGAECRTQRVKRGIFPASKNNIFKRVSAIYSTYSIMAVSRILGTSLPTSGPGLSAFKGAAASRPILN